ncbi:MAG: UvrD-helicase domain-containing protein, partial [Granulosicoccaceae bacterium]
MQLNPQQHAAVHHVDSPLLVLAGAGSGKTGVITQKIAYLLRERAMPARNIFAVTFTNKAANEMRARLSKMLGPEITKPLHVSTFHTLGLRMLREDGAAVGL